MAPNDLKMTGEDDEKQALLPRGDAANNDNQLSAVRYPWLKTLTSFLALSLQVAASNFVLAWLLGADFVVSIEVTLQCALLWYLIAGWNVLVVLRYCHEGVDLISFKTCAGRGLIRKKTRESGLKKGQLGQKGKEVGRLVG